MQNTTRQLSRARPGRQGFVVPAVGLLAARARSPRHARRHSQRQSPAKRGVTCPGIVTSMGPLPERADLHGRPAEQWRTWATRCAPAFQGLPGRRSLGECAVSTWHADRQAVARAAVHGPSRERSALGVFNACLHAEPPGRMQEMRTIVARGQRWAWKGERIGKYSTLLQELMRCTMPRRGTRRFARNARLHHESLRKAPARIQPSACRSRSIFRGRSARRI
jgi:hypothetical protein